MNYGYARCSTNESKQDIHRQIKELKAAGAETIVFEYEHGDAKIKKKLESLLEAAQPGDTLITTEVSRLSRSTHRPYHQNKAAAADDCGQHHRGLPQRRD